MPEFSAEVSLAVDWGANRRGGIGLCRKREEEVESPPLRGDGLLSRSGVLYSW